jgi:nucleoid-associated protein YgaU
VKRIILVGMIGIPLAGAAAAFGLWGDPEPATPPGNSPVREAVAMPASPRPPAIQPVVPGFDVVRVGPSGEAVIAGRAGPHATVTVLDAGRPIGRATADRRGEWVLLPERPLAPGERELSLSAQGPDSAAAVTSDDVVMLVVPDRAPGAADAATGALAVAVPREGPGVTKVLQVPPSRQEGGAVLPPNGITIATVDYDSAGQVSMGGRAFSGMLIQIYLDNEMIGKVRVDATGQWRFRPDRPVTPGRYRLRADQIGDDGRVTARTEIPFQMANTHAGMPDDDTVVVQPGNSLWRIARRSYGEGIHYTLIFEANQDQIRDPHRIYPGQIIALPVGR